VDLDKLSDAADRVVTGGLSAYDFSTDIGAIPGAGDGLYTATVQAIGNGGPLVVDGEVSDISPELDRLPPYLVSARAVNGDLTAVNDTSNTSVTKLFVEFSEKLKSVDTSGTSFKVIDPVATETDGSPVSYSADSASLYDTDTDGKTVLLVIANAALARANGLRVSLDAAGAVKDMTQNQSNTSPTSGNGAPASITWWDHTPPGDVTIGAAPTIGDGLLDRAVKLTWTDPTDADYASVEISWSGRSRIVAVNEPDTAKTEGGKTIRYATIGGEAEGYLTAGTPYTFTFKTIDTAGNKQNQTPFVSIGATPIRTSGIAVEVDFSSIPGDAAVTAKDNAALSWTKDEYLNVSVPDSGTVIAWYVDGVTNTPLGTSRSAQFDAQDFSLGSHAVSVMVKETMPDGSEKTVSKTVNFSVGR
jgi:hypothetical protein